MFTPERTGRKRKERDQMERVLLQDERIRLLEIIYAAHSKMPVLNTGDIEEHFNMAVRLVSQKADTENAERA